MNMFLNYYLINEKSPRVISTNGLQNRINFKVAEGVYHLDALFLYLFFRLISIDS